MLTHILEKEKNTFLEKYEGQCVRFQSSNFPDSYIGHKGTRAQGFGSTRDDYVYMSQSDGFYSRLNTEFFIVANFNSSGISIESALYPEHYLIYIEALDLENRPTVNVKISRGDVANQAGTTWIMTDPLWGNGTGEMYSLQSTHRSNNYINDVFSNYLNYFENFPFLFNDVHMGQVPLILREEKYIDNEYSHPTWATFNIRPCGTCDIGSTCLKNE